MLAVFLENHFLLFLSTWGVPSAYATVTTITVVSLFNTTLWLGFSGGGRSHPTRRPSTGGVSPPVDEGGEPDDPRWRWVRLLFLFFFLFLVGCLTGGLTPPDYTVFSHFRGLYLEVLYQQDTSDLVSSYFRGFDPPPEGGLDLYRVILDRLERAHRIEEAFSAAQTFITGLVQRGLTPAEIKEELTPKLAVLISNEILKLHQ